MEGGGTLTLKGANFAPTGPGLLRCLFGAVLRVDATFLDAATVECRVPPCDDASHACLGTLQLRAAIGGDDAAAASETYLNFTYYDASSPPALSLVLPDSAGIGALVDTASPQGLTLHAANLAPTLGALRCKFYNGGGGWVAESVIGFVHGGLGRCPLPDLSGQFGSRLLALTHDGGGLWSAPYDLTIFDSSSPPTITSVSPLLVATGSADPSAPPPPPTPMTLGGSNFAPLPNLACAFVDASGTVLTPATFISDAQVICSAPSIWGPGAFPSIAVTLDSSSPDSPIGIADGVNLAFYDDSPGAKPTVLSISPPYGSMLADASFSHTLKGRNFAPTGALSCRYGFGADAAFDVPAQFVDTETIRCARPAFSQPLDVPVVASLDGAVFSTTAARFTYYDASAPPAFSAAAPRLGPMHGGTVIYVTGSNFVPLPTLACSVGGVAAPATFDSSRLVRCETPPRPDGGATPYGGSADEAVAVSNDGSLSVTLPTLFTYHDPERPPIISALAPRYGGVAGGETVTVSGTNFQPTGSGLQCLWAAGEPSAASFDSHRQLRCVAPPAAAGDVVVGVTATGDPEDASLPAADGMADRYTYRDPDDVPTAFSVAPGACDTAAACALAVSGKGFLPLATLALSSLPNLMPLWKGSLTT